MKQKNEVVETFSYPAAIIIIKDRFLFMGTAHACGMCTGKLKKRDMEISEAQKRAKYPAWYWGYPNLKNKILCPHCNAALVLGTLDRRL